jgi:hypothetical protein
MDDIFHYGPPCFHDSSIGESNYKIYKQFGQRTQRNTSSFEIQVAKQDCFFRVID